MKRLLLAGVLFCGAAGQVFAADLPVTPLQPPIAYVAAPVEWGGFYAGLNGGYGFGSSDWTSTVGSIGAFRASGPLAGGTLGLNLPIDRVLLGVEADGDWASLRGSSGNAYCSMVTAGATCETKENILVTLRGRFGYTFNRVLLYGTAGLAWGNIETGISPPSTFDTNGSFGWTAGGGVEVALSDRWSAKVEYLYVDLDSVSCTSANCGLSVPVTASLTENVVRGGINFRFGPW